MKDLILGWCAGCRKPSKVPLVKFPVGKPIRVTIDHDEFQINYKTVCKDCVNTWSATYILKVNNGDFDYASQN